MSVAEMNDFARPRPWDDDDAADEIADLVKHGRLRGRSAWADASPPDEHARLDAQRSADLARHEASVKWEVDRPGWGRLGSNITPPPVDVHATASDRIAGGCENPHRTLGSSYAAGCRCERCRGWGQAKRRKSASRGDQPGALR
jgi:hypothetical protein